MSEMFEFSESYVKSNIVRYCAKAVFSCSAAIGILLLCSKSIVANETTAQVHDRSSTKTDQQPTIQFLHEDYPPYVYNENGIVKGSIAKRVQVLMGKIGYGIEWQQTNYSRLVRELQFGKQQMCAAGYSDQHQENYLLLASKPMAWFPGAALVIRAENLPLFSPHRSIQSIMNDTGLRGAFMRRVSYQGISPEVLVQGSGRHLTIGGSDTELGMLVARGRVHFAPINPDQTEYLKSKEAIAQELMVYSPEGMRAPRSVGLICSPHFDKNIFKKINDAIGPLEPFARTAAGYQ